MKHKPDCCHDTKHPDHSKQLPSLNRAAGQIEGIKKMIEERRYCPDILVQLRALRAAVGAIETNILESHLDACVTDALKAGNKKDGDKKISELKEIYRRFSR
jgi:DNA-binding FrmR family transcriptional regulator